MTFNLRSGLICCLLATSCLSFPACAVPQDDADHTRSAFASSDKRQWEDAISHASSSSNQILQTLMEWQYLLDPDSGASFSQIKDFILMHPNWPEQKRLRIRAEMMLPESDISTQELTAWFNVNPPITGVGKLYFATALSKEVKALDKIEVMIREAWRDGDFADAQEKFLTDNYGKFLRKEDDTMRTDRLLWEKKTGPALRMFTRVDDAHQKLYKARIALQTDKKDANKLVSAVPANLRKDPGLTFDRMAYRSRKDDDSGVREMLFAAPKKIPYPEKWWKYRDSNIREAMSDGNIKLAERLLSNHGQEEGQEFTQGYADASWLKGRLLLEHKQHYKDAYNIFAKMFAVVKYPVSKSRAAYWAGIAARKIGDKPNEAKWLETAANYPTTFYGQLASLLHKGASPLTIPSSPSVPQTIRDEYNSRDIVQAVKLAIEGEQFTLAEKIINHLVADARDENEALLASELGEKAGKTYLSVRGAKKALRNNVVLVDIGYPLPKTSDDLALPSALALSITRQESEFDNFAKSPAGAVGLMQLLPSTAKEVARKNDISYESSRLYEKDYNMQLGSLYLRRMIDNYDGSLVMAIAAYNAGPGNVYKWVKKHGRPQNNIDGAVDWIENIPFPETRNYVQRVLENLQVYRYLEARRNDSDSKLLLGDDLVR